MTMACAAPPLAMTNVAPLELEWRFLTHEFALVPRFVERRVSRFFHDEFLVDKRNSTLLRFG
jgi:hypothetical protein